MGISNIKKLFIICLILCNRVLFLFLVEKLLILKIKKKQKRIKLPSLHINIKAIK